MKMNADNVAKIKYTLAVIIYGTIGLSLAYVNAPTEVVVLCRGVIGTLVIMLYMLLSRKKYAMQEIKDNLFSLVGGGVCLGLNWVFLFAAYRISTVALGSLCNYTAPIIVVLISPILYKSHLTIKQIICIAIAFVGMLFVSGVFEEFVLSGNGGSGSGFNAAGLILGMLSALCFVGIVIFNRRLGNIGTMEKTTVQLATSAITVLPYVIWNNWGVKLDLDARSILLILMLGIVHTGIAYILYFSGLGQIPVQSVAVLGYLEPVVAIIVSFIFLHQSLTVLGVVGAVMVLGAALTSELQ